MYHYFEDNYVSVMVRATEFSSTEIQHDILAIIGSANGFRFVSA